VEGNLNKGPLLILSLILSLASTPGSAQPFQQNNANTEATTLEEILDKYVQALGGRASVEKVNSRTSKGSFTSIHLKTKLSEAARQLRKSTVAHQKARLRAFI
jgi:hypothetical protein